jgi:hypothetical protein
LAEGSPDSDVIQIGLFNRKANLGRLRPPLGYRITFSDEQTTFRRLDIADSPELAGKLSVYQRIRHLLRGGAMTQNAIAAEIEARPETVNRTIRRYKSVFTVLERGRIGLLAKGKS